MIFILDDNHDVVALLSNTMPKACPYFNDVHRDTLESALSTYTFEVPMNEAAAQEIVGERLIIREDIDGHQILFRIKNVEEEMQSDGTYRKIVFAENAAVTELLGSPIRPYTGIDLTADEALDFVLQGTGWVRGAKSDIKGVNNLYFKTHTNALDALHKVVSIYKGELQFRVQLTDEGKLTKRFVYLKDRIGTDNGKRFEYKKDILGIKRTEDTSELVTAIIPLGKTQKDGSRMTIESVNGGSDMLVDEDALEKYGGKDKQHIVGYFEDNDAETPQQLKESGQRELNRRKVPRYTYETSVALIEGAGAEYAHEKVRLGDTVLVIDKVFSPPLLVEARVTEVLRSYADPTKDQVKLGNFKKVVATLPASLDTMKRELEAAKAELTYKATQDALLEVQEVASSASDTASTAASTATTAKNTADTAKSTADTAKKTADTAKSTADTAKSTADSAASTATIANSTANTAKSTADGVKVRLDDQDNDNKLTPVQKQATKKEWDGIVAEKPILEARATALSITTELTTYQNAYNTLESYLSPLLSSMTTTSSIVGTTYRANFATYNSKKAELEKKISDTIKQAAVDAKTTVDSLNDDINTNLKPALQNAQDDVDEALSRVRNVTVESVSPGVYEVDGGKVKVGSITANQIAAGAISTDKLAANAVTAAKIAANTITAGQIASRTITAAQIQAGTITSNEIKASTITGDKLVAGTITSTQLATGSITAEKIATGAITADKLDANAINGKIITGSTITGGSFTTTNVDTTNSDPYLRGTRTMLISGSLLRANGKIKRVFAANEFRHYDVETELYDGYMSISALKKYEGTTEVSSTKRSLYYTDNGITTNININANSSSRGTASYLDFFSEYSIDGLGVGNGVELYGGKGVSIYAGDRVLEMKSKFNIDMTPAFGSGGSGLVNIYGDLYVMQKLVASGNIESDQAIKGRINHSNGYFIMQTFNTETHGRGQAEFYYTESQGQKVILVSRAHTSAGVPTGSARPGTLNVSTLEVDYLNTRPESTSTDVQVIAKNIVMTRSTGSFLGYAFVGTGTNALVRSTGEVRALQTSSLSYINVRAAAFPTGSSLKYKSNLEKIEETEINALDVINRTQVWKYHLNSNLEQRVYDKPKVGVIMEMVDPIIRDEDGVDPYSMVSLAWKAIQELTKKNAELEERIKILESIM